MAGPIRRTDLRFPIFLMVMLAFMHDATCARLEPGKEKFTLATSKNMPFAMRAVMKSMFENTAVKISIAGDVSCNTSFTVGWELRYTRCAQLYTVKSGELLLEELFKDPSAMYSVEPEISVMGKESIVYSCDEVTSDAVQPQFPTSNVTTCYVHPENSKSNCQKGTILDLIPAEDIQKDDSQDGTGGKTDDQEGVSQGKDNDKTDGGDGEGAKTSGESERRKRDTEPDSQPGSDTSKPDSQPGSDTSKPDSQPGSDTSKSESTQGDDQNKSESTQGDDQNKPGSQEDPKKNVVALTPVTGSYLVMLNISAIGEEGGVSFDVTIDMKGPHGYLSATQYPLLKFYGVMCGVYTLFGFTWLFLLCRQYQDLLGIQIWIGVVILLGLVEKAAFYGEFEHMNNKGTESSTGILLAELVSCVKRTLARLLVVVVSIGYGITRPRLGTDLNYIMAAGLLYMTLSSAEAIMRVSESYEHSMVAVLPLSVLEAILVWWILRNLVDTTRTLRLRNNETKLWLYRHFTNTLLLCIVFSIIFSIWSMKTHRFSECVEKHYELWLDDAFWHILFCVILFVVMILFRPSANNQRYAYSPLIDEEQDDEESKEPMLSEAYDGMKMRNLKKDNPQNAVKDIADDLKWVEDNIPAAIADSALAIMDDSEEELVTNLERSKMD